MSRNMVEHSDRSAPDIKGDSLNHLTFFHPWVSWAFAFSLPHHPAVISMAKTIPITNGAMIEKNLFRPWGKILGGLFLVGYFFGALGLSPAPRISTSACAEEPSESCVAALSDPLTVDTKNVLSVSGRVLDGRTRLPVEGVEVRLSGLKVYSTEAGLFQFTGGLFRTGSTVLTSRTGYLQGEMLLEAPAGTRHLSLPDLLIFPAGTGEGPHVTGLEARPDGLFLWGMGLQVEWKIKVDWRGNPPGVIAIYGNNELIQEVPAGTETTFWTLDLDRYFSPTSLLHSNLFSVVARTSNGFSSEALRRELVVIPAPGWLRNLASVWPWKISAEQKIGLDFSFPNPEIEGSISIPFLKTFGTKFKNSAGFEYTLGTGQWELFIGAGREAERNTNENVASGVTVSIGKKQISTAVKAGAQGTADAANGITLDRLFAQAQVSGKIPLAKVGLPDLFGPGLSTLLRPIPGLNKLIDAVSIGITGTPSLQTQAVVGIEPEFTFQSLGAIGTLGLEAAYEPELSDLVRARIYLAGKPSFSLQMPGDPFKELRFQVLAGLEVKVWFWVVGPYEVVFIDLVYPDFAVQAKPSIPSRIIQKLEPRPKKSVFSGQILMERAGKARHCWL
jgi:hypothetical protein